MLQSRVFDVERALSPARRALGTARCARAALRGLLAGGLVALLTLAAGHAWAIGALRPVALLMVPAGVLLGLARGIARWPDEFEAARAVDHYFGLGDRLTTALELRHAQGGFAALQRADAARVARGLPLGQAGRGRPRWPEVGVATGVLAGLIALAAQGIAPARIATAHSDTFAAQRMHRVVLATLPAMSKSLDRTPGTTTSRNPELAQLRAAVSRLQRQLLHAGSLAQALRAVSLTQQQLHQMDISLHPLSSQSVAQLNRSLANYLSAEQNKSARPAQDAAGTAQALNRLAASLRHLRASQQQRLAQALSRAANRMQDAQLRNTLHQAARALHRHDAESTTVYLKKAVSLLNQSGGAQTAQARLRRMNGRLDQLKNLIAAVHGRRDKRLKLARGPSRVQTAKHAQKGRSSTTTGGRSAKTRHVAWQPPTDHTAPNAIHMIANIRHGGEGGARLEHPENSGRHRHAASSTFVVRGQERKGSKLVENGPSGSPQQRAQAQYHALIVRYAQTARNALERTSLPPDVQAYVRHYFSQISR